MARMSTSLPLPSSPHWAPNTTHALLQFWHPFGSALPFIDLWSPLELISFLRPSIVRTTVWTGLRQTADRSQLVRIKHQSLVKHMTSMAKTQRARLTLWAFADHLYYAMRSAINSCVAKCVNSTALPVLCLCSACALPVLLCSANRCPNACASHVITDRKWAQIETSVTERESVSLSLCPSIAHIYIWKMVTNWHFKWSADRSQYSSAYPTSDSSCSLNDCGKCLTF